MAVREAFADNFATRGDVGAAVCVYVEGTPVVDLWGGYANAARTRPWHQDTTVSVASTTKGMVALCTHMLVERGLLDLDAPVARYWPEFAQADKAQRIGTTNGLCKYVIPTCGPTLTTALP
jgi:CubicO group peptidase (beta-lactamase class C family)